MASGSKTITLTNWNTLVFAWSEKSQSIANNNTVLSWSLTLTAGAYGRFDSSYQKNYSITVNGNTYTGTNTVGIANNSSKVLASGETTIPHNADGTKSFSWSYSQEIKVNFSPNYLGTYTDNGTGTLTAIPRQANLTAAPNFTDEQNPTITYSNPAGNAVSSLQACISLDGSRDDIAYRDVSKTGSTYTFTLTEAERNILRNATTTAKSRSVIFYLRTVLGGNTYYSTLYKTLTIANAEPTISATVIDELEAAKALTGSADILIKGFNAVRATMGATAKKGATITSYKITNGSSVINQATATFSNVDNGSFTFYTTDSRGYTATATVNKTLINYFNPTANLTVEMPTTEGNTTMKITGTFFNGSFGAVNNALVLEYRVKENNGDYGDWITVAPTVNGNNYTLELPITGLNYRSAYTFEARAKDKIREAYSAEVKVKTTPVYDWGEEDFNFNVPVNVDGALTVNNGLYLENNKRIFSYDADGEQSNILALDGNGLYLGYGGYSKSKGFTNVDGDYIHLRSKQYIAVSSPTAGLTFRAYGVNKVLWSGALYMSAAHTATLSEAISAQPNGVVLIWSAYSGGALDYAWNYTFIPKFQALTWPNTGGSNATCYSGGYQYPANKYFYIHDTKITGNDLNSYGATTTNGITHLASYYVLRYVIGV